MSHQTEADRVPRSLGHSACIERISRRMLSLTLRNLERDGLVTREVFPEIPPRVEYEVTPFGRTLSEPVLALARWAADRQDTIRANRRAFDQAAGLG
ncbi:Transcriptional regulator, HxlR family [[Actinomadura] parvosata subsp. kistnae]|uniref:winged helix-turn-helix transcriptional regulator n=1 Tax=[Actinomadura] parvosata TaxID=1955412 RepID=UPI000D2B8DB6|nr:helix-turn-helix domain-containing protein [Nonomuraea sp. ATCC 55076]SPL87924.1 Transcriptional regulator, HxlR family [Actinomadura parvosata subsp. kistnae]